MKTIYIEKMDKPIGLIPKIKMEQDNCQINVNLQKEKHIRKIINKLLQNEVTNAVLSKELYENTSLKSDLSANNINIFDGRWLEKYLAIQILDYIIEGDYVVVNSKHLQFSLRDGSELLCIFNNQMIAE